MIMILLVVLILGSGTTDQVLSLTILDTRVGCSWTTAHQLLLICNWLQKNISL